MDENEIGTEDQEVELEGPEDEAAPGAQEATDEPAKPTGKERKKIRFQEHKTITEQKAEIARLREEGIERDRRMAELIAQVGKSTEKVAEAVDRQGKPQPKGLRDRIRDKLVTAASNVHPDNASSAQAYIDAQADAVMEAAAEIGTEKAREIAKEIEANIRKDIPQQPNPENLQYLQMAPWLRDPDLNDAVESRIKLLVRKDKRNMRDPKIRHATITEAIVSVGADAGETVNTPQRPGKNGHGGVAGAGSGTFAGGSDESTFELSDLQKTLADRDPILGALAEPKRYAEMKKRILRQRARAS